MFDKVLAIVRETLLHENLVESLVFRPASGELLLDLGQPDHRFPYPEHELLLTFSGLRSLSVDALGDGCGEEVRDIRCAAVADGYEAEITVGDPGAAGWLIRLAFAELRYQRSPRSS